MTVPPNFLRVIPPGTCGFRCLAQFILAGAVCDLQTNELRDTGMSRLRRVTRLCSSMLSVNCEKVERATQR